MSGWVGVGGLVRSLRCAHSAKFFGCIKSFGLRAITLFLGRRAIFNQLGLKPARRFMRTWPFVAAMVSLDTDFTENRLLIGVIYRGARRFVSHIYVRTRSAPKSIERTVR